MSGKLIFFDIDGTLLDHHKQIPPSAKQAIAELKQAGHEVAIATGRGPFMFKEIREELGIDSYISYNGQYVVHKGEVIRSNPLSPEKLERITAEAAFHEHPIVYMDHETMKSSSEFHAYIVESISTLKVNLPELDAEYFRGRSIYQCLLFCTIADEAAYKDSFPDLDFIRWHQFSMDVLPLGGSKALGVEEYIAVRDMIPTTCMHSVTD